MPNVATLQTVLLLLLGHASKQKCITLQIRSFLDARLDHGACMLQWFCKDNIGFVMCLARCSAFTRQASSECGVLKCCTVTTGIRSINILESYNGSLIQTTLLCGCCVHLYIKCTIYYIQYIITTHVQC